MYSDRWLYGILMSGEEWRGRLFHSCAIATRVGFAEREGQPIRVGSAMHRETNARPERPERMRDGSEEWIGVAVAVVAEEQHSCACEGKMYLIYQPVMASRRMGGHSLTVQIGKQLPFKEIMPLNGGNAIIKD